MTGWGAPYVAGAPTSPGASCSSGAGDDSSSAGASGWSSSAGLSSLHTASFDGGAEDDGLLFPGTQAGDVAERCRAAAGAAALAADRAGASRNRDAR